MAKMSKKKKRKRMPKKVRKQFAGMPEQPMMVRAQDLGTLLFREYMVEETVSHGCGDLLLEWTGECFWGRRVELSIPVFDTLWKGLDAKGYTRKNKLLYGDADGEVWIEYPKTEGRRVVISERHCAMRDDNIYIFIEDKSTIDVLSGFRCATIWQRQTKHKYGTDRPSLNTYRKADFRWGSFNYTDKGHVFLYNKFTTRVEKAAWTDSKIPYALDELTYLLLELEKGNA